MRAALERHGRLVYSNSLGAEAMVLTDIIWSHFPQIEMFSIDTGRLPEETYALLERLQRRYGRRVRLVYPDARDLERLVARQGVNGFYGSLEARLECCRVRKVEPFRRAIAGFSAWVTGVRREQSAGRAQAQAEEWDADYGLYKISPLLDWSEAQVWQYIRARAAAVQCAARPAVPEHRLLAVHPGDPAGREPPRRTLVVGAIRIARMRPAPKTSDRGGGGRDALGPRMDYLPVFLRVEARPVVVVGGGEVALRKAQWLLKAGARVTVVAPQLHAELAQLRRQRRAHAPRRRLRPGSPRRRRRGGRGHRMSAPSTRPVSAAARARGIPVNVVDDAELSTFIFPAIIDRSPLIVAVSSAGAAPVLARGVRAQIEALLPARLGALARFMGRHRKTVQRALAKSGRRAFWERIVHGPVASDVLRGREAAAAEGLRRELRASQLTTAAPAQGAALGEVYLIGAGPGDPDLLTLRALQLLQQADVILYDRLVSEAVLERARRDARRIFVGKESGERGQQERIHALLVELAGARPARGAPEGR